MKPNTLFFFLTAGTLALVHYLAIEFYLYWLYMWLDMPMHFLGGVTVALGYLSLRDFVPALPARFFRMSLTLAFVALVAVAWELFELWAGIPVDEPNYVSDTLIDLALGLLGGCVGYLIGKRAGYFNYEQV